MFLLSLCEKAWIYPFNGMITILKRKKKVCSYYRIPKDIHSKDMKNFLYITFRIRNIMRYKNEQWTKDLSSMRI